MICWFLLQHKSLLACEDVCDRLAFAERKEVHKLVLRTSTYGSSARPRWFSLSHPYHKNGTHRNPEIGLDLTEIYVHDLTESVCSIDQRPHILVAFAELDYPLPGHQKSRIRREGIYDNDYLRSFSLLRESHILGRRLNLVESCLEGLEDVVKRVGRNDFDSLQCDKRASIHDISCRFVDRAVGSVSWGTSSVTPRT